MSRPPGTYSDHDDVFTDALFSVRNYADDVASGMVDDEGEDLSAAASALGELLSRDADEGASQDETYRALESRGVTVPPELKDLASTYLY